MNDSFVSFDTMRQRVVNMLKSETITDDITPIYLVRDLFGKVRIFGVGRDPRGTIRCSVLAAGLHATLGKTWLPCGRKPFLSRG